MGQKVPNASEKLGFWQSCSSNNDGPLSVEYQAGKKDKGGEKRGFGAASVSFSQGDTDGAVLLLQGQRKNFRAAGGLEGREEVGVGG